MAENAETGTQAIRDLLIAKGLLSRDEWDAAYRRVETERRTLFQLDPDAQAAVDELRRLFPGSDAGARGEA